MQQFITVLARFAPIVLLAAVVWYVVRLATRGGGARRDGPAPSGQRRGAPANDSLGHRSPYEVLQVSPGASREEITAAYRRLVQQYHPDKVAELGPELRELAEQRMKEINWAYRELTR